MHSFSPLHFNLMWTVENYLQCKKKYATNTVSTLLLNTPNLRASWFDSICSGNHGRSPPSCIYAAISSAVLTGEVSVYIAANQS